LGQSKRPTNREKTRGNRRSRSDLLEKGGAENKSVWGKASSKGLGVAHEKSRDMFELPMAGHVSTEEERY